MEIIQSIPNALGVLRIVIAIILAIDSFDGKTGVLFVVLFLIAALSDACDGIIARKLGVASKTGSEIDSRADAILYCVILYCIWRVHPEVIKSFFMPLIALGVLQGLSWLISFRKFGRTTCYHTHSAKVWAVAIFVGVFSIFTFNYAGIFFWLLIVVGYISILEDILITFVIPSYSYDVMSLIDALKLKKFKI